MADSPQQWIARQNIRRFRERLETAGSSQELERLQALLAREIRKLDGTPTETLREDGAD